MSNYINYKDFWDSTFDCNELDYCRLLIAISEKSYSRNSYIMFVNATFKYEQFIEFSLSEKPLKSSKEFFDWMLSSSSLFLSEDEQRQQRSLFYAIARVVEKKLTSLIVPSLEQEGIHQKRELLEESLHGYNHKTRDSELDLVCKELNHKILGKVLD